jgi:hypothetical protein
VRARNHRGAGVTDVPDSFSKENLLELCHVLEEVVRGGRKHGDYMVYGGHVDRMQENKRAEAI